MIRTLLATTAMAALMTAPVLAQDTDTTTDTTEATALTLEGGYVVARTDYLATRLLGTTVYSTLVVEDTAIDPMGDPGMAPDPMAAPDPALDDPSAGREAIGDINDFIVDENGNVSAVIIGIGGFLGIGQRNVAVAYSALEWEARGDGEPVLMLSTTREALENAPEFDLGVFDDRMALPEGEAPADDVVVDTEDDVIVDDDPADPVDAPADDPLAEDDPMAGDDDSLFDDEPATDDEPLTDEPATDDAPLTDEPAVDDTTAPADDDTTTAPGDDDDALDETVGDAPATAPVVTVDPATTTTIDVASLSADELIGSNVVGAENENIGNVDDLILAEDGQIDAMIVDVGGFLGIGAHTVAIGLENVEFSVDENDDLYAWVGFTQDQLEAQPEYIEADYVDQRDQMRMVNM